MRTVDRQLEQEPDSERGAAGVLVAVMMLVLIGVGAIAVDVGQIYAERAELQNAADAGALAGAEICSVAGGARRQTRMPSQRFSPTRTPRTESQASVLWT